MFDVFCPRCDSRVLLTSSRVRGIDNDTTGIHVHYSCWCGHEGTWDTGRPSAVPAVRHEPVLAGTAA